MKYSTALTFIITGIVKDIVIVTIGWVAFSEHISGLQALGFILQIFGIAAYSCVRSFPAEFADKEKTMTELMGEFVVRRLRDESFDTKEYIRLNYVKQGDYHAVANETERVSDVSLSTPDRRVLEEKPQRLYAGMKRDGSSARLSSKTAEPTTSEDEQAYSTTSDVSSLTGADTDTESQHSDELIKADRAAG